MVPRGRYRKVAHQYTSLTDGSGGCIQLTFHRTGGQYHSWEAEWQHPQLMPEEAVGGQRAAAAVTQQAASPAGRPRQRPKCRRALQFALLPGDSLPRRRADKVFRDPPPDSMVAQLAEDFRAARDRDHLKTSDGALHGYAQMLPRVCAVFKKRFGDEWDGKDPLAIVDTPRLKAALRETKGSELSVYGNNSNGAGTPSAALHWYRLRVTRAASGISS
jgi:hypothetical protein